MELWEKVLAARNKAEAAFPHPGERREMEVFIAMVAAIDAMDEAEDKPQEPAPPQPVPTPIAMDDD